MTVLTRQLQRFLFDEGQYYVVLSSWILEYARILVQLKKKHVIWNVNPIRITQLYPSDTVSC